MYFTSDAHFYHTRILEFCDRPVGDLSNEDWLYEQFSKIPRGSTVWHLGDLSFNRDKYYEIFKRLIVDFGLKLNLIIGNHDDVQAMRKAIIRIIEEFNVGHHTLIKDYYEISKRHVADLLGDDCGIPKICLFHYAIEEWNQCHRGSLMFHGHSHGSLNENQMKNRIDVGIDSIGRIMHIKHVVETLKLANQTNTREPSHH